MLTYEREDLAVKPCRIRREVDSMSSERLHVRLQIPEIIPKRGFQFPRTIPSAENVIKLSRNDQHRSLEGIRVERVGRHLKYSRRHTEEFRHRERLLILLRESGHIVLVFWRFEEAVDVGENVAGRDVARIEGTELLRVLQVGDARREALQYDPRVGPVDAVACQDGGVGYRWIGRQRAVGQVRAEGVADEDQGLQKGLIDSSSLHSS